MKKHEKLPAGAEAALNQSGWQYDSEWGEWVRDVTKDQTLKEAQAKADELRTSWFEMGLEKHEEFVIAVMKLLGVLGKFPYQNAANIVDGPVGTKVFEADVLRAARDLESERSLARLKRAVKTKLEDTL